MEAKKTGSIRKKLTAFCMLCILFIVCIGTLTVYAQGGAKLTASAGTAQQGKTVAVTFTLEGNPGIWGLKFRVGYDHSALKLTSVTNGTIFSDGDVTLPETLDKEQFVYLASANKLENTSANGTMVTLNFTVADSAQMQAYPITLEVIQAINVDGDEIAMAVENGSVTVKAIEPDNTPAPPADNTPVPPADNTPVLPPADNTQGLPSAGYSQQTMQSSGGQTENEAAQRKKTDDKKKKQSPRTGDSSTPAVWIICTLAGGSAFSIVCTDRRRKNTKADR